VAYDPTIYRGAARYYRVGRPQYSAELTATLAAAVPIDGTGRLLDVGCGPGTITVELAGGFDEAVGLDPDADMLAEGARRATEAGVGNVRWVQARAEDLADPGFEPGPLRLVTFGQSLHWTDRGPVIETVYDRLEPGGAVALLAHTVKGRPRPPGPGDPPIPHDELRALITRYLGERQRAGQGFSRPPTERYEQTLARSSFGAAEIVFAPGRPDIVRDVDGVIAGYLSMSYAAPHLFGDRLADFVADARALLAPLSPSGRFWDWPGDTEIVIGHKRARR
jgi:ubiquinone/menaquinone biosynthesis C-methylase UbiE